MNLRYAAWLLGVGLACVVIGGGAIAWANRGSQTVGVAYTTLIAAMALFGLNLFFQLRGSDMEQTLGAQVLLNTHTRELVPYPNNVSWSFIAHREAVDWLRANRPDAFADSQRVAMDLVVYGIVRFIAMQQPDWRMKFTSFGFSGGIASAMTTFQMRSTSETADIWTEGDLRAALRSGGNVFADAPLHIMGPNVRFPKGSAISVRKDGLRVECPVVTVDVGLQLVGITNGIPELKQPGGPWEITHADGTFSLYDIGVRVTQTVRALRSQAPDLGEYRTWFDRLSSGARDWFRPIASDNGR